MAFVEGWLRSPGHLCNYPGAAPGSGACPGLGRVADVLSQRAPSCHTLLPLSCSQSWQSLPWVLSAPPALPAAAQPQLSDDNTRLCLGLQLAKQSFGFVVLENKADFLTRTGEGAW